MPMLLDAPRTVCARILDHLVSRIEATAAEHEPFSHIFLQEVFPREIYRQLLGSLPEPKLYKNAAKRHHARAGGASVRSLFELAGRNLELLPMETQELWQGVAEALTDPVLKRAMFNKLAKDLAFRFGVPEAQTGQIPAFARPTLYRETAGFEMPPHPDTRCKIVTMQLYLAADRSQLGLGTALYRRKWLAWPMGGFAKVKQFPFEPNSGYAFVVNNTLTKKSWHGREELPDNAGVRNTLLNTYYDAPWPTVED